MEHIEYNSTEGSESNDDGGSETEPQSPKFAKGDKVKAKLKGENPRIVDATILKVGTSTDYFNDGRFYIQFFGKMRGAANRTQITKLWVSHDQLEAHVSDVTTTVQPTSPIEYASGYTEPFTASNEALQQFGPLPSLAAHHEPRAKKMKSRDGRRGSTSAAQFPAAKFRQL